VVDQGDWIARAVARHERPLVQYATHLLHDAEAARDVVQETFYRLCDQSPASLDGRLTEWLYTVCRNRAMDELRKARRMKPATELVMEMREVSAPAAAAVEREEQLSGVVRAVGALPARQQEVVRLKFQQGLSYKQIAAVTGLSVSNVGYLLHMAIQTLRQRLAVVHEGTKDTNGTKKKLI
jgi:RNA polymerase sigma factor (sigma-70 family)